MIEVGRPAKSRSLFKKAADKQADSTTMKAPLRKSFSGADDLLKEKVSFIINLENKILFKGLTPFITYQQ